MSTLSERAQSAQKSLFGLYDRLNDGIKAAEKRLTSYHVPYELSVSVVGQYATDYYAIARIKGEWRLCYGQTNVGYGEESEEMPSEWRPLIDCSGIDRAKAGKHLPSLEAKLVEASERFIPYVESGLSDLERFLASTV